jgi:hypothetical protein
LNFVLVFLGLNCPIALAKEALANCHHPAHNGRNNIPNHLHPNSLHISHHYFPRSPKKFLHKFGGLFRRFDFIFDFDDSTRLQSDSRSLQAMFKIYVFVG